MSSDILRHSAFDAFSQLPKSQKLDKMAEQQVGISTYGTGNQGDTIFDIATSIGLSPLRPHQILAGMNSLIHNKNIRFPIGKHAKSVRGSMAKQILDDFTLVKDTDSCRDPVEVDINGNHVPLSDLISSNDTNDQEVAPNADDPMVFGKVIDKVNEFVGSGQGRLAVEMDAPTQIHVNGPRITIQTDHERKSARKYSDKVISVSNIGDKDVARFGLVKEIYTHSAFDYQRGEIARAIEDGRVRSGPKFTLDNWPKDCLMTHLRKSVDHLVEDYERRSGYIGDPKDLKYQVLFRLTTLSTADIFHNGDELEGYMHEAGAYENWRNILCMDANRVQGYEVKSDIVIAIAEEQALVIKDRIRMSKLPLDEILHPSGIFAEPDWVIQKRNGRVCAIQESSTAANRVAVPLSFEEVDPKYADQFHRDLHYIHTPRADVAFGMFVSGDTVPFSVVALERVDRDYKANALLFQGYDPRKTYDLTRLYSRPGTPGNTSSSMFALTFNYLKEHFPEMQAVLSSFMPSYSAGISMTSGGFNNPILVKPLVHTFGSRTIEGKQVYEHLTNRRQNKFTGKRIYSRLPLLPTVELLSPLQPPRFSPSPGADKIMIEL